jgi:multicomponent Na+:H+ antiporter subunit C
MSVPLLYGAAGIILFLLGTYGLFAYAHLLRKVLAANIMSSGVFMVFIAVAARTPGAPDPVPHAMVLTGIVVTVAFTSVALALAVRIGRASGRVHLPERDEEQ